MLERFKVKERVSFPSIQGILSPVQFLSLEIAELRSHRIVNEIALIQIERDKHYCFLDVEVNLLFLL